MKALEAELVYKRHQYQEGQYYTAGYDHPWKRHHRLGIRLNKKYLRTTVIFRRNEVWMQSLEPEQED